MFKLLLATLVAISVLSTHAQALCVSSPRGCPRGSRSQLDRQVCVQDGYAYTQPFHCIETNHLNDFFGQDQDQDQDQDPSAEVNIKSRVIKNAGYCVKRCDECGDDTRCDFVKNACGLGPKYNYICTFIPKQGTYRIVTNNSHCVRFCDECPAGTRCVQGEDMCRDLSYPSSYGLYCSHDV
ncbi:hypothetical protein BX616_003864 [Lobosporangium transversale]|uniref:Uncharacterized protein n=1 Tax=Lobosporangium transversale TaxID=64571 RepID=A0A1Y2GWS2_9FUNG|nr:hypothetical protein BCR41DRAFT_347864 [Lobosporangium transversale]KAF9916396.1 hypothetical protein BX616_003864 [Lobosporangium transversale]ORZ26750.1 hypothetical protein BCR41DRAFT_347864 [Lobosporangium transversale]|eukprot:XP_021884513.1 hypothetical protein BCR41DRAFT_347864 [Lobosporangium transversale]